MRLPSLWSVAFLALAAAGLAGCGGGGTKFDVASQDIRVTDPVLPQALSGQTVNYAIPLEGGCGGPYVMSIIAGAMPPGLALDNATLSIKGVILQSGNYSFTLQIDDTGCRPDSSTVQQYTWNVGIGPVTIAVCDPPIIPLGSYSPPNSTPFNDCDGLRTTVYGEFSVFNFTVAGGTPPYTLELVDDPQDALDSNWGLSGMPQGMSIPPSSTSFIGAPQQTGGATPFRMTFKAIDAFGQVGYRKLQWKVDTPPIVVATPVLPDGRCGTAYSQFIQIVDGVPPFEFELVKEVATVCDTCWQSPLAPILTPGTITVNQVTGRSNNKITPSDYPSQGTPGPYGSATAGITPEGVFLREATGLLGGIPRRHGQFTFHVHVFSMLVPNEYGQHAWQTYTPSFANSEPPASGGVAFGFTSLNTWTMENALLGAPLYSTIPELERGVAYNPDGGTPGLSFRAIGGVPKDGYTDGPHFSQISNIDGNLPTQEQVGGYDWTINWNPLSLGTTQPAGTDFAGHTGVLSVTTPSSLVPQGRQVFSITASDQQLPTSSKHSVSTSLAFSVGPDKVVITESTSSLTATGATDAFNDQNQTVRILEPLSTGAVYRNLTNADDLTANGLPNSTAGTALGTILSSVDLMRVSVNPTGWWDDTHGLNASGARPGQHSDMNKSYTYSNSAWQSGANPIPWNPSASAVRLPNATGVTTNRSQGIYASGGRLYAFENSSHVGVFIVREDSKIYLPVVLDKANGWLTLGDGVTSAKGTGHSLSRMCQLTISPDGRFGAMKMKQTLNMNESVTTTSIVLFSLTGERVFDGNTRFHKIIGTGSLSGGSTSTGYGAFLYGSSLALTNSRLYYLCGNYAGNNSGDYAAWAQHAVYAYTLNSGNSAGELLAPNAIAGAWVNNGTLANMMSTPFHKLANATSLQSAASFATGTITFTTVQVPNDDMYMYDGSNLYETALAPMPFRVSKNGTTVAILAGPEVSTSPTLGSVNRMNHYVFTHTSSNTLSQINRLTTVLRHSPQGGGRGYSLARGPSNWRNWGTYTGPTTGFEISDDATKVAVVVNRSPISISPTSTVNWYNYREDIVAFTTTNGWSTVTEVQVTGVEGVGTQLFGGTHIWRFGALVFTADNNGLIFWGGWGAQNQSLSQAYQSSRNWTGTFYSWNFGTSTLRAILPTAAGGGVDSVRSYSTSSVVNPTWSAYNGAAGRIRPLGGFISRNRNFLYVVTLGAVSASDQAQNTLVGVNIRSLNTAQNINGWVDGEGFRVTGQPARRGAIPGYYYTTYYPLEYRLYAPANVDGMGGQVMAKSSGYVFYTTHYQGNGPTQSTSTTSSFSSGTEHPMFWGDYGGQTGQVEGFSADVGGRVYRMSQTSLSQSDSTAGRPMHHLETNDQGTALAFVYDTGNNQNYTYSAETVGLVQGINFDANTGVLLSGKTEWSSTLSGGRVSDAMAIDSTGTKLYVAFGTGDENAKSITEVRYAGTTFSTRAMAGNSRRYNVLHSGR